MSTLASMKSLLLSWVRIERAPALRPAIEIAARRKVPGLPCPSIHRDGFRLPGLRAAGDSNLEHPVLHLGHEPLQLGVRRQRNHALEFPMALLRVSQAMVVGLLGIAWRAASRDLEKTAG